MLFVGPKSLRITIILCYVSDNDTSIFYITCNTSKKTFYKDNFIRQPHTQQTFHHNLENTDLIVHYKTTSDVSDFAVLLFRAAEGGYTNNLTWLRSMSFQ